MILALDPSFSGFGIAVVNDADEVLYTKRLSTIVEGFRNTVVGIHNASFDIINQFRKVLIELKKDCGVAFFDYTIVEYPAYQTRSGSELMVLNGMLAYLLRAPEFGMVYWLTPIACNAYIGNKDKTKSFIVDWAKKEFTLPPKKRISHDECTCLVFVRIMQDIIQGKYKKSYFKASDEYDSSKYNWIP